MPVFTEYAKDALQALALPSTAQVLDVATGPGTLALLASPRVAQVTAVDFSPAMVRTARENVKTQGLSNVEVHLEDGQRLPFDNRSFDAAFSLFGLIFFPDRAQGLFELYRVLRPEGKVAITSWLPFSETPMLDALFSTVAKHVSMPFGKSGPPPLGTPELIEQELKVAGFQNVQVKRIEHTSKAPSLRAYWDGMVRSSAPITLLQKTMATEWPLFEKKVLKELEAKFGSGPQEVPAPAWLTTAERPA